MKISEWIEHANSETEADEGRREIPGDARLNLHGFNAEIDFRGANGRLGDIDDPNLREAYARFVEFLKSRSDEDDAEDHKDVGLPLADYLLKEFYQHELHSIYRSDPDEEKSISDIACYAGPAVSGVNKFVTMKRLDSLDTLGIEGFDIENVRGIYEDVEEILTGPSASFDADGHISLSTLENIQEVLAQKVQTPELEDLPEVGSPANYTEFKQEQVLPESVWITDLDGYERHRKPLAETATGYERSGIVAGFRSNLGVFHKAYDRETDETFHNRSEHADDRMYTRVLVVVEIELDGDALAKTAQPTIFSGGIPELFVSRPRTPAGLGNGMLGKAVKLAVDGCKKHGRSCPCGSPGLSEAIIQSAALKEQKMSVSDMTYITSRELTKYTLPDLDHIKIKNG